MKNKNKLKYLTLGMLLTGAVGFSTLAVKQVQVKAENENVVNINRENKKLVSYDDNNYTITLSLNEVQNYSFSYFYNDGVDIDSTSLVYNSVTYTYQEDDGNYVTWINEGNFIYLIVDSEYFNNENGTHFENYQWCINEVNYLEHDLTIVFDNQTYDGNKEAIELDIQANESSYGESIITAISSGLGLIPDLAQEFLTGFTTLFWDSVNEKLTDFGTFALVFLGVAITMAVVKLCLAILRSNTGA